MFTVDELLSKTNQRKALAHFKNTHDSMCADGMRISELEEYWQLNSERIISEIKAGTYEPGIIENVEIINGKGKRRIVSNFPLIDRFITRLLAQKLARYIEPQFMTNSFAYQEGKGVQSAVMYAQKCMEQGLNLLVEIDLKDYFDTILLSEIQGLLKGKIDDKAIIQLISKYLYCKVKYDKQIVQKKVGLVQGSSLSPILSNLYLHSFDSFLEQKGVNWMRFADNIYIFAEDFSRAVEIYNMASNQLQEVYHLKLNEKKSGVYNTLDRRILGYEFYKSKGGIGVRKWSYKPQNNYANWHSSAVQKINNEFHLIQDGVLNKKDYALLFENENEKHHIPVEVIDHISMYGNITMTTTVLKTVSEKNIRLAILDKYGNLEGYYVPDGYLSSGEILLKQCDLYLDVQRRLVMAKAMEIAGIHNMRANLRYYAKKKESTQIESAICELSNCIEQIKLGRDVEELLLIEGRARQKYYAAFNCIIANEEFKFVKRTKRPPEDAINALISFGNTLLYNQFLQIIWKTALDPRIGIVHATNRRCHTLDLDFADIYKPLVVDRVIFSLINLQQIKAQVDFEESEGGGIYLSNRGKKVFVEQFEEKLASMRCVKGKSISYKGLMINEVRQFQKAVQTGAKYSPYKYY